MDNLPQAQQNEAITPLVGNSKSPSLRKLLILTVIVIAIFIAVIGSFWAYQNYFSPKVRLQKEINVLINSIQNPDQALIAACNPQPHLLKQDQELIVYGDRELPDPNKYQEQKFTKPGLVDVKASLEQGDKTKASEQLATVWQRIGNPVGCFNASGKPETSIDKLDDVVWSQEQVNVLDPQRRFVPKTAKGWGVSKIKQEAVKQFLKLWYGLNK